MGFRGFIEGLWRVYRGFIKGLEGCWRLEV